jgi:hypothetical protein
MTTTYAYLPPAQGLTLKHAFLCIIESFCCSLHHRTLFSIFYLFDQSSVAYGKITSILFDSVEFYKFFWSVPKIRILKGFENVQPLKIRRRSIQLAIIYIGNRNDTSNRACWYVSKSKMEVFLKKVKTAKRDRRENNVVYVFYVLIKKYI